MLSVAQPVARPRLAGKVGGSNPLTQHLRNIAQSGSASAWGAEGRRFKSGYSDQIKKYRSIAQFGSAPALEAGGRGFKSLCSDQNTAGCSAVW